MNGYQKCQYCQGTFLSRSVQYHQRLCPAKPVSRTSPLAPRPGPPSPYNTPPAPVTSTRTASSMPATAANTPYNIYSNGSLPHVQTNHHFPPSFYNGTNTSVPNTPFVISSNYPTVPIATATPTALSTQPFPATSSPSRPRPAATTLNGSPTLNINIVTWNIEKGTSPGSTAGFTEMRRFLLSRYSNRQPETFFCLQEIKMSSPFTLSSTLYSDQPGGKTDKEAGVGCPVHIRNCNVTVQQPPPQGSACRYNDTANCRFYGTIVRIEDTINRGVVHQFLLVSYHGKYNKMSSENRKKEISAFFKQMCTVADTHRMTVIIGGDFNLRVDEWRPLVIGENKGRRIEVAANYAMGPRRRGSDLLDTFAIVYPQGGIRCTVCTMGTPAAVDLEGALQERLRTITDRDTILQERRVFNIMDHDPVCMSVTLSTPQ